jgi:3-dehydroquinate synthetase
MAYLVHDKKNKGEIPQFVLLEAIGKPVRDVQVPSERVREALEYVITKVPMK